MDNSVMNASMNLLRRLPAKDVPKNLAAISELIQDDEIRDDVTVKTDKPLEVGVDEQTGENFLKCEYYHDGDSFRSPWSNQYYPRIEVAEGDEEPLYPSQELLEMEGRANEIFGRYCKGYYDKNFLHSVYFFDTDQEGGFGSCWLVKKVKNDEGVEDGAWDAVHLVTTNMDANNKCKYRLNSTIYLTLDMSSEEHGKVSIAGHIAKVKEEFVVYNANKELKDLGLFHIRNMGELIEANEKDMRAEMTGVYINKGKQIIHTGRLAPEYKEGHEQGDFQQELIQTLKAGTGAGGVHQ